jgi:Rrf2 family transcriptional regulator, iron-sulfur cluster assembly transcription factor
MDLIRRNTDYAIRAMVYLAKNYQKEPVSAARISQDGKLSYQLLCKLLQKLQKNRLVKSSMGPRGGFSLGREPSAINILQIIEAIQGPVSLNRCLLDANFCKRKKNCPVSKKLSKLQKGINRSLAEIKLEELAGKQPKNNLRHPDNRKMRDKK